MIREQNLVFRPFGLISSDTHRKKLQWESLLKRSKAFKS
jgi:hypothetical protein